MRINEIGGVKIIMNITYTGSMLVNAFPVKIVHIRSRVIITSPSKPPPKKTIAVITVAILSNIINVVVYFVVRAGFEPASHISL